MKMTAERSVAIVIKLSDGTAHPDVDSALWHVITGAVGHLGGSASMVEVLSKAPPEVKREIADNLRIVLACETGEAVTSVPAAPAKPAKAAGKSVKTAAPAAPVAPAPAAPERVIKKRYRRTKAELAAARAAEETARAAAGQPILGAVPPPPLPPILLPPPFMPPTHLPPDAPL